MCRKKRCDTIRFARNSSEENVVGRKEKKEREKKRTFRGDALG